MYVFPDRVPMRLIHLLASSRAASTWWFWQCLSSSEYRSRLGLKTEGTDVTNFAQSENHNHIQFRLFRSQLVFVTVTILAELTCTTRYNSVRKFKDGIRFEMVNNFFLQTRARY